ncbi:MAG: CaiB/BaiF CoA transferase family protein [Candidatus Bipolaricaulaceae bacterium]
MKPLDGIRVLDLSRILAGPLATMWMADLGAEVIKVERPGVGDESRRWGPPFVGGQSAYFLAVNRGKYGVTLDLSTPAGQRALHALVKDSDVLVHNFLPRTATELGVDYPRLQAINPHLVYLAVGGFGPGPYRHRPGFDAMIQAMAGLMAITGDGDQPAKVGVAIVDVLCGWAAVAGTLSALLCRTRTGRGQEIQLSLAECAVAALVNVGQAFLFTGQAPPRLGTAHPQIVPYQAFPSQDGLLMVAVGTDAQFRRLCQAVGLPRLASDPRFATNPARVAHREELVAALSEVLRARPRAHWLQDLLAAGVPCSPVNTLGEVFGDPGVMGRVICHVDHPTAGRYPTLACPLPQGHPPSLRPPPELGQHNQEVLGRAGD